ncbi:MAG: relaxase [Maridesulfovibrio ferrireducens]|nr:relaxase [Maridesulfovibrio ferrireducens]
MKADVASRRAELRKLTPFNRWNDFLKWKAENGDEIALQVLRSKKEPIQSIPSAESDKAISKVSALKLKQSQIRSDSNLAWKDKRRLLSISKMLQLQAEEKKRYDISQRIERREKNKDGEFKSEKPMLNKLSWRVDSSGNILYTLESGGMVKDNGDKIFFSMNDPKAGLVAEKLAKRVFGPNVQMNGNEICRLSRGITKKVILGRT